MPTFEQIKQDIVFDIEMCKNFEQLKEKLGEFADWEFDR